MNLELSTAPPKLRFVTLSFSMTSKHKTRPHFRIGELGAHKAATHVSTILFSMPAGVYLFAAITHCVG